MMKIDKLRTEIAIYAITNFLKVLVHLSKENPIDFDLKRLVCVVKGKGFHLTFGMTFLCTFYRVIHLTFGVTFV